MEKKRQPNFHVKWRIIQYHCKMYFRFLFNQIWGEVSIGRLFYFLNSWDNIIVFHVYSISNNYIIINDVYNVIVVFISIN